MKSIYLIACFNSLLKRQCSLAGTVLITLVSNSTYEAVAQIQPDNSLGSENSIVSPALNLHGMPTVQIEGGAIRGDNLFHSFQEFNITEGTGAYFIDPAGISNIFSRVTGSEPSHIRGVLGVLGNANLFFLNPHGILFGSHARLDITGSFSASTGDRFLFDNGYAFSASNPQAPPLLSMRAPIGLQYGVAGTTASITNRGILSVGQDLTLAGGRVTSNGQLNALNGHVQVEAIAGDVEVRQLQANSALLSASQNLNLIDSTLLAQTDLRLQAQDTITMRDSTLNPMLIQAGGELLVQGDQAIDIFALNHLESGLMAGGDLVLRSRNQVAGDAHYWAGGNFRIEQLDGTLGDLYSPYDPIIRASGDVTIGAYRGVSLHILAGGQVNIPHGVLITGFDPDPTRTINPSNTASLQLPDGTSATEAFFPLSSGSFMTINGSTSPTLDIRAGTTATGPIGPIRGSIWIIRPAPDVRAAATGADINIGDIVMQAPNGVILLTNHYLPNQELSGGDININLNTIPTPPIPTGVGITSNGVGNSISSLTIDARKTININAPINLSSAIGDIGNLTLLAKEAIVVNQIIASNTTGMRDAGTIILDAPQVTIQNGANVSVNTLGSGTGGTITVNAQQLDIKNRGQLSAITGDPTQSPNSGKGGTIVLNVSDRVTLDRGFIFTGSNSLGSAGSLTVNTQQFTAQGGSLISASSSSSGQAGTVTLNAPNGSIEFIGNNRFEIAPGNIVVPTTLSLGAFGNGEAGSLAINTRQLTVRDGAQVYGSVSASSPRESFAADVTVNASESVQVVGATPDRTLSSRLSSDTFGNANAGTLTINTPLLSVLGGGQISAGTTGSGEAGRLTVQSNQVQVIGQANASTPSRITFDSFGAGDAGGLNIQTSQLQVAQGGKISARTGGTGQGGVIDVIALGGLVQVDGVGSGLFFDSQGTGNARGIKITTGELQIRNNGEVTVSSSGTGNPGDIQVDAAKVAIANGGSLNATINSGQGGNISVTTEELTLANRGQISVSSNGSGDAGNIQVQANNIFMADGARLIATINSGQGGNISLTVKDSIRLRRDSDIRTNALGSGNGGNLFLQAGGLIFAVLSEDSDIIANAPEGRGGDITASAEGIFTFNDFQGEETPLSDFLNYGQQNGALNVDTRNPQPTPPLDDRLAGPDISPACAPNPSISSNTTGVTQFYQTGRGGVNPDPGNTVGGSGVQVPWGNFGTEPNAANFDATEAQMSAIGAATGWQRNANGNLVLVGPRSGTALSFCQSGRHL